MSDDKYTIQEMMAAIKKGLDSTRKEYPYSVNQLIKDLDDERERADREHRNYQLKYAHWEEVSKKLLAAKEEIDRLKKDNDKLLIKLARICDISARHAETIASVIDKA